MPSTFTPNLNLELMATGEFSGTWGQRLDNFVFTILDNALGNTLTLPLTNVNVTLSTSQSQNNYINLTGTLTGNVQIIFPQIGRTFFIANNTTGAFTVTLKTSAVSGATYVIPQGQARFIILDGTNVLVPSDGGFGAQTNIASAATTDLGTVLTRNANVTGTTTITSFGSSATTAAPIFLVTFAGALTLTYNAGSLIIPGAANITTAPGDMALVQYLGSGNWKIISYTRAAAAPYSGSAPNITVLTSGSGTYTTPSATLYLRVRMIAGAGGGAAVNTNSGTNGTDTSFGTWTAIHGSGGAVNGGAGGAGGTGGTNGTGTVVRRLDGAAGQSGTGSTLNSPVTSTTGGAGGSSPFGGAGSGTMASTGGAAKANTGSGGAGGGAGGFSTGGSSGAGGGAGEFVEFIIAGPSASYSYAVGTGGTGGTAGGNAGGNGAAGRIEVEAYFQ